MLAIYSKEDIERAKHRGRAYECLACYYQKGERKVIELHQMEGHILKVHITTGRIPHFCRLCLFRCMSKQQIIHHVTDCARHVSMAKEQNILNISQSIAISSTSHQFMDRDYRKLSAEESLQHFLQRQGHSRNSKTMVATSPQVKLILPGSAGVVTPSICTSCWGLQIKNPMVTMEQGWSSRVQQPRFVSHPTPVMPANEGASRPLGKVTVTTLQDSCTNQMFSRSPIPVMPASDGASRATRNFTLTSMDSTSYDLNTPTLGTTAIDSLEEATGYQYQPESSDSFSQRCKACSEFQQLVCCPAKPDKSAASQHQHLKCSGNIRSYIYQCTATT